MDTSNEFYEESFSDIARICVKKQEKGPFDQLITDLYRLRRLIDYYPHLDHSHTDQKKLKALIIKGLKYKSFKEFHTNVLASFQDSAHLSTFKDFFSFMKDFSEKETTTIEKAFMKLFQQVFQQHYHALNFLKSYVDQMISQEEIKLEYAKNQSNGNDLKIT